ncbi:dihydrodipicolinate synthase family protein [Psychromarinibacter sp. S121]|uniref:dihydrodipicolinate synthase family protein n=1 Tax=Psychromarinibacter sp. S121 TaxID=3415127 RepID=UPI003C7AFF95
MTAKFRGTYSVMVTAYDDAGAFDPGAMARYTNWQIEEGIHGLMPLGSTGEFLSLTTKEREAVARCVVDTTAGRVPVLIGAGAERTEDVIENCRMAADVGAQGMLIIPPFYSTPTEDELYRHYERIAASTNLPIMIYNNPATSNVDLTPPIVARLSEIDGVDYIKESTMDVTRVRDIIDMCGDRMTVFGGIMGFESFVNGAVGWVAVASNVLPKQCADLFTLTADKQDYDAARALYHEILPMIRLVGGHRYVSATKAALKLMGMDTGNPRAPRLPLPASEMPILHDAMRAVGLMQEERA